MPHVYTQNEKLKWEKPIRQQTFKIKMKQEKLIQKFSLWFYWIAFFFSTPGKRKQKLQWNKKKFAIIKKLFFFLLQKHQQIWHTQEYSGWSITESKAWKKQMQKEHYLRMKRKLNRNTLWLFIFTIYYITEEVGWREA